MSLEKSCGIVAEFNPLHSGHALLMKRAREMGFTHIAVVMSGNYTQRGEAAVMLKEARVREALLCGADLVLELPCAYAVSSAKNFAFGAVSILDSLGCLDSLVFGSESADTEKLVSCSEKLKELDGSDILNEKLSLGVSFPKALSLALDGKFSDIISNPNDTLGLEYISALNKIGSKIKPFAIKREGAWHDKKACEKNGLLTASASEIRRMILNKSIDEACKYMPENAAKILKNEIELSRAPFNYERASLLMLAKLRTLKKEDYKKLPDVCEGLENRLFEAAKTSSTIEDFCMSVKSKRYTLSRIRRIALCAYLGIEKSFSASKPPYLRVLGFNKRGVKLLAEAKKNAALPIVSRCADIKELDRCSQKLFELECRATDLYTLCLPKILSCGCEQKFKTVRFID